MLDPGLRGTRGGGHEDPFAAQLAVGVGAEGAPVTVQADVDGAAGIPVGAVNEGMVRSTRSEPSTRKTVDGWAAA